MEQQELFRAVVNICVLIIVAEVAASLNARLKLPRSLGPLVAGILFSPHLIGGIRIGDDPFIHYSELVYVFSEMGAILVLFEAGLHITFGEILKSGRASFTVSAMGVAVTYMMGLGVSGLIGNGPFVGMIVGGALAATSVAISVTSLGELGQLETPEAKMILAAAVIDDVLALSIASLILSMLADPSPKSLFTAIRLLATTIIVWFLLSAASSRLVPRLTDFAAGLEKIDVKYHNFVEIFGLMLCFGYASISGLLGLSPLVGAFIAGMALSSSKYREEVTEFTGTLGIIFIPLFFVIVGSNVNLYSIMTLNFVLVTLLALVAVVSKLLGCGLPASFFLKDPKKGLRVGYGMISRREIALVIAGIGITYGIINDEVYTALVVTTFITMLLPPLLLRRSYLKDPTSVLPDSIRR